MGRSSSPDATERRNLSPLPPVVVAAVALLAHGYEIFSFHLGIDEPWQIVLGPQGWAEVWLGAGRWAMAGVSLLLPRQPGPVVPTAVGVTLSVVAWWLMTTRVLRLRRWPAAATTALAATTPAYALIVTYAGNIVGTGLGQVVLCGFGAVLAGLADRGRPLRGSLGSLALLVLAAMVVTGLYEGLLPALGLVVLLVATARARVALVPIGAATALVGALLSGVVATTLRAVTGVADARYRSQWVRTDEFLADPFGTLAGSIGDAVRPFVVSTGRYGVDAPWVWAAVVLLLAVTGCRLLGVTRADGRRGPGLVWTAVLLVATALVLVLVAALTIRLQLRSQTFLPWVWLVLGLAAFGADRPVGGAEDREADVGDRGSRVTRVAAVVVAAVLGLAVLSQASVTNAIYLAGAQAVAHDEDLALRIDEQRRLLGGTGPLPVVVRSDLEFAWGEGPMAPATETVGLSLFRGDPVFVSRFLVAEGLPVTVPSEADVERGSRLIDDMPVYPRPGWVQVRDGLLLVRLVAGEGAH